MGLEGRLQRATVAGASVRKARVASAPSSNYASRLQRASSWGCLKSKQQEAARADSPASRVQASRSEPAQQLVVLGPLPPPASSSHGDEPCCGSAAWGLGRHRSRGERREGDDASPSLSSLSASRATICAGTLRRESGASPDVLSRLASLASPKSPYVAFAPPPEERNVMSGTDRSRSSSAERQLDSFRPSFRVDWLVALRKELLSGIQQEAMALREDYARAIDDIVSAVETQLQKGVTQMQASLCQVLDLDAERVNPETCSERRLVEVDLSSVIERINAVEADIRSMMERLGDDIFSVVKESALEERDAREKANGATAHLIDEVKHAQEDIGTLTKLVSALERRPPPDLTPILNAIEPLAEPPKIDFKPVLMPFLEAIEEGIRPLSEQIEEGLRPISEQVSLLNARPQNDLKPVLTALEEQKTMLSTAGEAAAASSSRRASTDYSTLEKKISDLVAVCASSHEKVSKLDTDTLLKELSLVKHLSNSSVEALDKLACETEAQLPRLAECNAEHAHNLHVLCEEVAAALGNLVSVKENSDYTLESLEKVNETIIHTLTQRTREIMQALQATSLSTSTVTARLEGLTNTADEILETCNRPRTDEDFVPVLDAIKGLEENIPRGLCTKTTSPTTVSNIEQEDLRLVLKAQDNMRAHVTQLLESVLIAANAADATAKQVASQQASDNDAVLKAIGEIASRPNVDLTPVLDAVKAVDVQPDFGPVLQAVSSINVAPQVAPLVKGLADGLGRLEARPDVDLSPVLDELRSGAERSITLLDAFTNSASRHTNDVDRMLSELAQCTAGVEACADSISTVDAKRSEDANKVLEAWAKSEQDLMKVVHDVRSDDLQSLAGSISSGFLSSMTAIAELSKVLSEVHDLVGDAATADEMRKGLESMLEGIDYLRSKNPDFRPVLDGLQDISEQHARNHEEIKEEVQKLDLTTIAAGVEELNAKPDLDLSPVLLDIKRVDGACHSILAHVGGKKMRNVMWTTPSAAF